MKKIQNPSPKTYHPSPINPSTSIGQTLIEVIVAIGIIIIVLIAVYALAGRTIHMGTISRQKLQAVNLAQEGIEAVRNIRDTNWIEIEKGTAIDWDEGIGTTANKGVNYDGTQWNLTGSPTLHEGIFTRRIDISDLIGGVEKRRITVTVSWAGGSQPVQLTEDITNWKKE